MQTEGIQTIRNFQPEDTNRIMQLWLEGNLEAHSFVSGDYWNSNYSMMKNALSQAEIFVFESSAEIKGFAGMQGDYLAGIFVDKSYRSMGIGKQLLDYIKGSYSSFTLSVYRKNQRAVDFYSREGLSVLLVGLDSDTGEQELTMLWENAKTAVQP